MVKKLKGKATMELKGHSLKQREKEYEEAKQFILNILPLFFIIFLVIFIYFNIKWFS